MAALLPHKEFGRLYMGRRCRQRSSLTRAAHLAPLSQARLHLGVMRVYRIAHGSHCTRAPGHSRARKGRDAPSRTFHLPIFPISICACHLTISGTWGRGGSVLPSRFARAAISDPRDLVYLQPACLLGGSFSARLFRGSCMALAGPRVPPFAPAGPSSVIRSRDESRYQDNVTSRCHG